MIQDLNQISDGKIYSAADMARLACNDCEGCHACCEAMGDSIILDPLDVWRLREGTGKTTEQLLENLIELGVEEGMILPHLRMVGEEEHCAFLNEKGRCSIHPFRPGLCRLFPLGRIYEEQEIRYFLQTEACIKKNRTKVKISKWLDTPEQKKYNRFLLDWHSLRKKMQQQLKQTGDESAARTWNLFLLNHFYISLYESGKDFYECFEERLVQAKQTLPFLMERTYL